jgi:hypothetical protein
VVGNEEKPVVVKINPKEGLERSVERDFLLDGSRLVEELSVGVDTKGGARKFRRGARVVIIGERNRERELKDDPNYPYQPDIGEGTEYLRIVGRTYNTNKGPVLVVNEIKQIDEEVYRAYSNL